MAFRISTGLVNAMVQTNSFGTLTSAGFLDLYSGSQPTTADDAETGTKLCSITTTSGTGGLVFGTAASGILPKSASVWSGVVLASGVAGWFRFYGAGKTTGTNGTAYRFDGAVGLTGSDLVLTHTSLVKDTTLTIEQFTITQPKNT